MRRALLLLLLAACGEEATLSAQRPKAVFDPPPGTTLTLDEIVLGLRSIEPRTIEARNEGAAGLELGWRVEGAPGLRVSAFPKLLEPGQDGKVWIRYEPSAPAHETATLVIETNDPELPEARFPIAVNAREICQIDAWPRYVRFKVGETAEISLLSRTSAPCVVHGLATDDDLFEWIDRPELPLEIPAGEERIVKLRHIQRTFTAGIPRRELRIRDVDGSQVTVLLEGAYPLWNCLENFPKTLEFPDTTLGYDRIADITVTNRCTEPAVVTGMAVSLGYRMFEPAPQELPVIVPALGGVDLKVRYIPFEEHGDSGTLIISTADAARPTLSTEMLGKALYPSLRTLPELELGPVGMINGPPSDCRSRVGRLPIWSNGAGPLKVEPIVITGPDAAAFEQGGVEIDGVSVARPGDGFEVPVGKKAEVLFRFRPLRASPSLHEVTITLRHYALSGPTKVRLYGRVAPIGYDTDTFEIGPEKSDVLFVVDDSLSMNSEQGLLTTAAESFVGVADGLGADYQLAAARADASSGRAGELLGCLNQDPILRSTDGTSSERAERLGCMMRTGRSGRDPQTGLGAAARIVQRAQFSTASDPSTFVNARFLRRDTRLVVVTASDEDDTSIEPIRSLLDFFLSSRGDRVDRFQIHSLAGVPGTTCPTDPFMTAGLRYAAMCTEAGGDFYDLCQPDLTPALTAIAAKSFEPSPSFELSRPGVESTLEVTLDGLRLGTGPDGYSYEAAPNTVTLHGTSTPTIGQHLEIRYRGECLP